MNDPAAAVRALRAEPWQHPVQEADATYRYLEQHMEARLEAKRRRRERIRSILMMVVIFCLVGSGLSRVALLIAKRAAKAEAVVQPTDAVPEGGLIAWGGVHGNLTIRPPVDTIATAAHSGSMYWVGEGYQCTCMADDIAGACALRMEKGFVTVLVTSAGGAPVHSGDAKLFCMR